MLSIENLKTYYFASKGPVRAVDGISFGVAKGEAVGLAGESGCGKSTTAYSILRLIPKPGKIVEGSIIYKDRDLVQLSEEEFQKIRWKDISMIFQSSMNALNPVKKVGSQIMDAIQFHKCVSKSEAMMETEDLFKKVGLPKDRINHYPFEFSGGMRQRAMIALSLSCEPNLIIADEPVTALDVTIQAQILDLIRDLITERKTSMLLITHDLSVIAETCDKIAIMYGGKIVEYGAVESIFLKPIHPYTKGLIDAIPSMDKGKSKKLFAIPGQPPDLIKQIKGCVFYLRCPFAKNICKENEPEPRFIDGILVKCHFAEEVSNIKGEVLYDRVIQSIETKKMIGEPILKVIKLEKLFPLRKGFLKSLLSREEYFLSAIDDISFQIGKGEIFGLVGESGCGKTTLAKCIVKLYEATLGQIFLNEVDITSLNNKDFKNQRRNIQMLFQDPYMSLDPRQNIYNIVAEPIRIHKMIADRDDEKRKVTELLSILKLVPPEDYMYKFPNQLSGGERQRVAIARVMALNPRIIIADEPVSMLDVSVRAGVLDIILQLRKDYAATIMYITHDLSVASYMADRLGVMYLGELVEIGTTENIVNKPLHPYTKGLIASVPSPEPLKKKRRALIMGEPPSPINPPSGCKFHPRCPYVMPICSKKKPQLLEHIKNHFVACLQYE